MNDFPSIVQVEDVSKRFLLHKDKSLKERVMFLGRARKRVEDFWALQDVSMDIATGSTVGLVGHNGSGKSTLLKVIGGIIQPTSGSVVRRGRMAALLELGAGFHPDLSGRENVYLNAAILGLSHQETDRHFDAIVEFSGIEDFIDTQVKFYSSGMYVRLAFSVAVHVDPDLLLVDEVLAVGDEPFQRKCMDKIAEFQAEGRTIVLVSHSSDQVGRLCDRVVVMQSGSMIHDGDPAEGIRVLRDGYEADRMSDLQLAREVEPQASRISIEDVTSHTVIGDGSVDVVVLVTVDVQEATPGWGMGIAIETTLGMRIYSSDTFALKHAMPTSIGRHTIQVVLPDVRLGAGKYLVSVGVALASRETVDRRPNAAAFDMPNDEFSTGLLRIRPNWQVDPAIKAI
ncbi:ABC transporter ATP-binding protein [Cryobacterium psychrophilum]|uniref:ABC transporter ATP-binding protein n=1 Tax=Cryobacterium psychrophilum TaxID=41988 RepID=A0A4Y8KN03_9MICO|nr:ABC transporter ATP-binding protein [Cryobacterium psychrophilum]TDW30689.1 ABC-2 type transport system ATP-binding protein [Cryobacterium psychrophilum]TFD77104.1 ABC transporter ATP-binding protein [Cryobacterium psychrophilum]